MKLVERASITVRTLADKEQGLLVELAGEFDLQDIENLEEALDAALRPRDPVLIDLSGVTFVDLLCVRELFGRQQSPGELIVLNEPSWQARSSLTACGLPRASPESGSRRPACRAHATKQVSETA